MKPIRRHLNYANVVATFALLFAMSGGALAAKHYLINSTKQINPKVLKKLKVPGRTGATGPRGVGTAGAQGATGPEGPKGPVGQSALSPLPSGQSESGIYSYSPDNTATGAEVKQAVSFPIKLAAGIPVGRVIYTTTGSAAHCSGLGHADAGYLCLYSESSFGLSSSPEVRNYEAGGGAISEGTGVFGFVLEWLVEKAEAGEVGAYTVTAP